MEYKYSIGETVSTLEADDKMIAYAAMLAHADTDLHKMKIISPESSQADNWTAEDPATAEQKALALFGGPEGFPKFLQDNHEAVIKSLKTIKPQSDEGTTGHDAEKRPDR